MSDLQPLADSHIAHRAVTLSKLHPPVDAMQLAIPRLARPPVIDGRIDAAEWAGAVALEPGVCGNPGRHLLKARQGPVFFLGWDPEHVFLAARIPMRDGEQPLRLNRRKKWDLLHWDTLAEFYIDAGYSGSHKRPSRYQFIGTASGNLWAIENEYSIGQTNPAWDGEWKFAQQLSADGKFWEAEFAIPRKTIFLPDPIQDGTRWKLGFGANMLLPFQFCGLYGYPVTAVFCDQAPSIRLTGISKGLMSKRVTGDIEIVNILAANLEAKVVLRIFAGQETLLEKEVPVSLQSGAVFKHSFDEDAKAAKDYRVYTYSVMVLAGGRSLFTFNREFAFHDPENSVGWKSATKPGSTLPVFVLPMTVGETTGWARDFTRSANIDVNCYLSYLDQVRDNPNMTFNCAEICTLIALQHMQPERYQEIVRFIQEGRIGQVCAQFVGECEPNLTGGEALVRQGVEGLRWNREVLHCRPRIFWFWDNCGLHEQMGQIAVGLGLDAINYSRYNASGVPLHYLISPDGSKALGVNTPYMGGATEPAIRSVVDTEKKCGTQWPGTPRMIWNGHESTFCLAPEEYPTTMIQEWKQVFPEVELHFSTMNKYLDALLPLVGKVTIPEVRGGWQYGFGAFWIQSPKTKKYFRCSEHALQSAEMLVAIASLRDGGLAYPTEDLHRSWIALLINMGRATLWSICVKSAVEDDVAWDAQDRFEYVLGRSAKAAQAGLASLFGQGNRIGVFNPANWPRTDAVKLRLPGGMQLKGVPCQPIEDGLTLCRVNLPSTGTKVFELEPVENALRPIPLPATIENAFYRAVVDPEYGDLVSLKLTGSEKELLAEPANVIVADQNDPSKCQNAAQAEGCIPRPERKLLMTSRQNKGTIRATDGPVALTVEVESDFLGGGKLRRTMRFLKDSPRIDFTTELNDIPSITTVLADFPLAGEITEIRRGIPYGFAHGGWGNRAPEELVKAPEAITPTIRWSDYTLADGAGVALLDQGLTGREVTSNRVALYLHHTSEEYSGDKAWPKVPSPWLSGKGRQVMSYALLAHDGPWEQAAIARRAWEFNCPPLVAQAKAAATEQSFVITSDNLLLESMRREGEELELRMVECWGKAGPAEVTINLPHGKGFMTDLVGERRTGLAGGPVYRFDVRSQQIVTLRFKTADAVAAIQPITDWIPLVPESKRARLYEYDPQLIGWAAQGTEIEWIKVKYG